MLKTPLRVRCRLRLNPRDDEASRMAGVAAWSPLARAGLPLRSPKVRFWVERTSLSHPAMSGNDEREFSIRMPSRVCADQLCKAGARVRCRLPSDTHEFGRIGDQRSPEALPFFGEADSDRTERN